MHNFHFSLQVSTIENTQDHKSDLKISGVGFLIKFSEKGKSEIELDYDSTTGLLISRADSRGGGVSHILHLLWAVIIIVVNVNLLMQKLKIRI
jgi:hypothetical protein